MPTLTTQGEWNSGKSDAGKVYTGATGTVTLLTMNVPTVNVVGFTAKVLHAGSYGASDGYGFITLNGVVRHISGSTCATAFVSTAAEANWGQGTCSVTVSGMHLKLLVHCTEAPTYFFTTVDKTEAYVIVIIA